ncbi:MAG TPA: prepilin-type N-terminal cleavage/methylation domain-containing protein [Caldimonas sp.]
MTRHFSRGVTIVELLVASAIGLIVVAAAGSVVASHQADATRLQTEARLMQDLRAASELVARDLRRAGHWSAAASAVRRGDDPVVANPHAAIAPASTAASAATLSFSTGDGDAAAVDDADRFGFRLRGGAIEMQLGLGNWQALSDPGTVVITAFTAAPRVEETALDSFCDRPCVAARVTCPPRLQVRSFTITLAGRAATDSRVAQSLHTSVRVRNDAVVGSCEG